MALSFQPAPTSLAPWVLGVSVWRVGEGEGEATDLPVPAHALVTAGLVRQGALLLPGARAVPGDWVTSGPASRPQMLRAEPGTEVVSVLLRASVLPLLTGRPASDFVDATVPLALLGLNGVAADTSLSCDACAEAFWAALALRLADARPGPMARRFARSLVVWDGKSLQPAGWSERGWQRACRRETGLRPKQLQRLLRLHASVRRWSPEPLGALRRPASWAAHAVESDFFDQSHWLRECRTLAGVAPARELLRGCAPRLDALRLGAAALAPRWQRA